MILENYKLGNLIKSTAGYKYFLPTKINEEWIWQDQQIGKLLEKVANDLVNDFVKAEIIEEITGQSRNAFLFLENILIFLSSATKNTNKMKDSGICLRA